MSIVVECTDRVQCTMGYYSVNRIESFFAITSRIDTPEYMTVLKRGVGNRILNTLSKTE